MAQPNPDPNPSTSNPSPPTEAEPVEAELVEAEPVDPPATTTAAPAVPPLPAPDYDEHGVPSFDYVRNKIEGQLATSIGGSELAAETPEGQRMEQQAAEREKAAKAKLDEIRRSLNP